MTFGSSLLSAIPGLRHAFPTREGGVSGGVYASLNGGLGSNDDPANVAENRRRMAAQMGVSPEHFLGVHQVHSPEVVVATGPWQGEARPRADAMVTRIEGLAIGVTAADCGPILLVDPNARVIGAALIIDYGHVRSDAGDTFQAITRHSFTDPLKNPGQADVTAHVDFRALARAAEDLGARIHGPITQGEFLKRLGIETRALTLMAKTTPEVSADISSALKRLTDSGRSGMGSMFKVLAISEPRITSIAGLSDEQKATGATLP